MPRAAAGVWLLLLAVLGLTAPACAHTRSESHAVWEINGAAVDLVMTLPEVEVRRIHPQSPPSDDQVKAYLAPRVYPLSAGQPCRLSPPIETLSAVTGFRRYDFTFQCPSAKALELHDGAFFDLVRSHVNFAQIQNAATGDFTEQLLDYERQTVEATDEEGGRLQTAGFLDFVAMGVMHIFTGVDHMSFLLGLVLISRRLRDLAFVVTGFTLGHSLTLALAVTGVIRPHAEFIDALVALTIALIGLENIAVQTQRPLPIAAGVGCALLAMAGLRLVGIGDLPIVLLLGAALFTAGYLMVSGQLKDAGRLRMVITLTFGLVHGFGFAADLLSMQLPPQRLAELLVGFNLGVEIGQLTLVAGASALVAGLSRLKLAAPRPIVVDLAAALLVGLGCYWFISRSFV
ncbi:MAG: HupE/UreJ family protein [Caulobacteraceae bacterium]|nr:HupE/UreJ family protein [Caulobacteraceae bacterium]